MTILGTVTHHQIQWLPVKYGKNLNSYHNDLTGQVSKAQTEISWTAIYIHTNILV